MLKQQGIVIDTPQVATVQPPGPPPSIITPIKAITVVPTAVTPVGDTPVAMVVPEAVSVLPLQKKAASSVGMNRNNIIIIIIAVITVFVVLIIIIKASKSNMESKSWYST